MRVFVLGTGRCGTMTFAKACSHVTNYTSGHETHRLHPERFVEYPDNHIEVDAHLAWMMWPLVEKYPPGSSTYYLHLWRDKDQVARSFVRRRSARMLAAVIFQIVTPQTQDEWLVHMHRLLQIIDANIHGYLAIGPGCPSPCVKVMEIGTGARRWEEFWKWIGAEGDMEAGRAEFSTHYNATHP